MRDSHVKGRLRDDPGEGEKAGQRRFRLTRADSAGPRPHLLSRRRAHVEQRRAVLRCASIRTLDGQDARELRYAAAVTIWVRWPFQPACGAETSNRVEPGFFSPRPDRLARRAGGVAAGRHSSTLASFQPQALHPRNDAPRQHRERWDIGS